MSTTPNQPGSESASGAVNYCQNCGRPLSAGEARSVGNMIFCEPCLAHRAGVAGAAPPHTTDVYGVPLPPRPPMHNSPFLAALLGTIPGVGAMYNGQVAKGLVHVLIFVALVSVTDRFGPFGILIGFWVFYQVFDAYQTAVALQRGLPLPDPLGLNNIGARFGFPQHTNVYSNSPAGYAPPVGVPVPPVGTTGENFDPITGAPYAPGPGTHPFYAAPPVYPPPVYGDVPSPMPPYVPPPMPPEPPMPPQHSIPTGAIVLIALGGLFLLHTAGYLGMHWLSHGWPLLLIGLGIWQVVRSSNRNRGGSL